MTIQSSLNQQAFDLLPQIKEIISSVKDQQIKDSIKSRTLRECMNSRAAIDSMTSEQLAKFQSDLIESFKALEWI